MTKDIFLTFLTLNLSEANMPKNEIDKRSAYFSNYFNGKSDEEITAIIEKHGGEKAIADKIIKEYNDAMHKSTQATAPKPAETKTQESVPPKRQQPPVRQTPPMKAKTEAPRRLQNDSMSIRNLANAGIAEERKKKFYTLLVVCSPLILLGALAVIFVFAFLFFAVLALAIAVGTLFVAGTAVGAAVALVGIVYGIIQIFTAFPIGLYEIGLGISIAGFTMIFGILLYNVVVKAIPYLAKKVYKFFIFVLKIAKKMYKDKKGEYCKA